MKNAYVVYCSPAGSTGHVAQVIANELKNQSVTVTMLDLGGNGDSAPLLRQLAAAKETDCLFVGSPVYSNMAVPPVMAFIDALPAAAGCKAVPFVTWGGACSGIALWQMGKALADKGYPLAGAAKVLGVHSLMWPSSDPVGKGHPDADDDRLVADLIGRVAGNGDASLALSALDYQPESVSAEVKKKLDQPWATIPKTVDVDKCTACEACVSVCPVGAVSLDPTPVFGQACFGCFNCVRECPEDAIVSGKPLDKLDAMIRGRVTTLNETPPTQIFV
ncbi:EFR1 family ferrodoxin [Desulfosarcina ovata]|uniref:(Fe-S)-binding protein n=1 Tax=Desulfosarcina ovata subsp. ovata TaxID=2752305 RepID=A0A5K8AEI5_9BACT|nr:EFR1 family ferrodoxin [Desulfosarcina ovata]BBO90370.1 (Fe-S)-binding protein [Desulfosarcina ovata subsp. ovata]